MIARSDQSAPLPAAPSQSETDQRGSSLFALVIALIAVAIHAVLSLGYLIATMILGARCDRTFRDFNIRLPTSTQFVIGEIRWLYDYWYVAAIMLVAGLLVDGFIVFELCQWPRSRGWGYGWAILIVVLLLVLAAYTALSLYMPYERLLEGLTESSKSKDT